MSETSVPVVMLPSLGRPPSDFEPVIGALTTAGHCVVPLSPPPTWSLPVTLHDLARDVVSRLDEAGHGRFHLIGHAFGNRLARAVVARFGERVASLTLLAAGGLVEPAPDIWVSLGRCFDPSLPADEHLVEVERVFFAPGNDASVWREGWMPEVAAYQRAAVQATPRQDWWSASVDKVLVVQGLDDAVAPPENGRRYVKESAPHARLVEIERAGHALLPEQPTAVAEAVLGFLGSTES